MRCLVHLIILRYDICNLRRFAFAHLVDASRPASRLCPRRCQRSRSHPLPQLLLPPLFLQQVPLQRYFVISLSSSFSCVLCITPFRLQSCQVDRLDAHTDAVVLMGRRLEDDLRSLCDRKFSSGTEVAVALNEFAERHGVPQWALANQSKNQIIACCSGCRAACGVAGHKPGFCGLALTITIAERSDTATALSAISSPTLTSTTL